MFENNDTTTKFQGSLLVEETRPEKGFFIKSKKRCFSLRDDKWHSKFSWEPVFVGDLWADETDGKCQMHFRVRMADGTRFQVDQPISRQRYNLFVGYKLDAHRVDLIEKVLHGNKSGLCIRKWIATELLHMKVTKRLLDELRAGAKKMRTESVAVLHQSAERQASPCGIQRGRTGTAAQSEERACRCAADVQCHDC